MSPAVAHALRSARLHDLKRVMMLDPCPVARFAARIAFMALHDEIDAERAAAKPERIAA